MKIRASWLQTKFSYNVVISSASDSVIRPVDESVCQYDGVRFQSECKSPRVDLIVIKHSHGKLGSIGGQFRIFFGIKVYKRCYLI
jgi:hypothetical protein